MRSLSRTWPPVTDRYARMRKRVASLPNAEELRAEFEQAWAELAAGPQTHRLMVLPSTGQRPTRAERRRNRMREHTRSLLINALRSDGTMSSIIRVQTCKAFRVLPWDIGFAHASRVTDSAPDDVANAETVREDVAADMGIVAAGLSFFAPPGLEFVFEEAPEPFPPIDTESDLRPYDLSDLTPDKMPGLAPPRPLHEPLRADGPAFPVGETASERYARILRWAGFDKPVEPIDLTAPAEILVELPEPPKDVWGAILPIISGSPLYEQHRGAGAPEPQPSFTDAHCDPRLLTPPPKRSSWHPSPVPREDLFFILAMALILAAVAALAITF